MSEPVVRLGFAGAGGFATGVMAPIVHACPGVVLQAVAARDARRAEALSPAGRVHASYESLMDDPDVDAVYIALSNDLHRPVAEMALRAGKHVLCEKPMAITAADAGESSDGLASTQLPAAIAAASGSTSSCSG